MPRSSKVVHMVISSLATDVRHYSPENKDEALTLKKNSHNNKHIYMKIIK